MCKYTHAIVVDKDGYKLGFVLAVLDKKGRARPLSYTMPPDGVLIFEGIPIALCMLKPRWNGGEWLETV